MKYNSALKECKLKKYDFWNEVLYAFPKTNDIYHSKRTVDEVIL